ncbi:MAG: hypothetical protein HY606_11290 [Planctomycetes bacterium]|nr:hypothetical protein [Planctomycetota bacterium]
MLAIFRIPPLLKTTLLILNWVLLIYIGLESGLFIYSRLTPDSGKSFVIENKIIEGNQTTGVTVNDSILGYKPNAGIKINSVARQDDEILYDVTYTIDKYSRRMTPLAGDGRKEKFALFFGCSFTFGDGLNDNQTLSYYFGEAAQKFEPYNYAYSGYGPQQMLAKIEGTDLKSEIKQNKGIAVYVFVGLGYWMNHFHRAIGSMRFCRAMSVEYPYYYLNGEKLERKDGFISGRPITSLLYGLIGMSQIAERLNIDIPSSIGSKHIMLASKIISESADKLKLLLRDTEFYLLIYPISSNYPAYKLIEPFKVQLKNYGVKILDYSNLFDPTDPMYCISDQEHPSSVANRIIANKISEDLDIK